MSTDEKLKIFHPNGPCSAICSIDPKKCPYFQAVNPSDRRSIPSDENDGNDKNGDENDEKESMDLEEPYEKGDYQDDSYSPIIPYMDTYPTYLDVFKGQYNILGSCKGLFKFPSGSNMNLFLCDSFNQFCIDFGKDKRTRLVTIIGEHHFPIHLSDKYNKDASILRAIFIDNYIRQINIDSNSVRKRLAVFLEDNPTFEIPYDSFNIWRIKSLENFIRTDKSVNHSIEPLLNIGNVDIRYIGYEAVFPETKVDFFSRSQFDRDNILLTKKISQIHHNYNNMEYLLRDTTIEDLRKLSNYLEKLLKYCCKLFKEDGRFKINQIFNRDHLQILDSIYRKIKIESNEIKKLVQNFDDYDGSTILGTMKKSDISISLNILRNLSTFQNLTDLYSMIQFFRKDYPYDDIILLIGEAHAQNIGVQLRKYIIKNIHHQNYIINLKDTYL